MSAPADALTGDALVGFNFIVDVATVTGYFTEVSGLTQEIEVVEQKIMSQGASEAIIRKQPGRTVSGGEITLKRGMTTNVDFITWVTQCIQGQVESARTDGTITMVSQDGTPVAMWNIFKMWASKVEVDSLSADGGDVTYETITIQHEGLERTQ